LTLALGSVRGGRLKSMLKCDGSHEDAAIMVNGVAAHIDSHILINDALMNLIFRCSDWQVKQAQLNLPNWTSGVAGFHADGTEHAEGDEYEELSDVPHVSIWLSDMQQHIAPEIPARRSAVRKRLRSIKMQEGSLDIMGHCILFENLCTELATLGAAISDDEKLDTFMDSVNSFARTASGILLTPELVCDPEHPPPELTYERCKAYDIKIYSTESQKRSGEKSDQRRLQAAQVSAKPAEQKSSPLSERWCNHCGVAGHDDQNCFKLHPEKLEEYRARAANFPVRGRGNYRGRGFRGARGRGSFRGRGGVGQGRGNGGAVRGGAANAPVVLGAQAANQQAPAQNAQPHQQAVQANQANPRPVLAMSVRVSRVSDFQTDPDLDGKNAQVDGGANAHIWDRLEDFDEIHKLPQPMQVAGAFEGGVYATHQGRVNITAIVNGERQEIWLNDVYYCPGIRNCLISETLLEQKGLSFRTECPTQDRKAHWGAYLNGDLQFEAWTNDQCKRIVPLLARPRIQNNQVSTFESCPFPKEWTRSGCIPSVRPTPEKISQPNDCAAIVESNPRRDLSVPADSASKSCPFPEEWTSKGLSAVTSEESLENFDQNIQPTFQVSRDETSSSQETKRNKEEIYFQETPNNNQEALKSGENHSNLVQNSVQVNLTEIQLKKLVESVHVRFGHPAIKTLKLIFKIIYSKIDLQSFDFKNLNNSCETCSKARLTRTKKTILTRNQATSPLERVSFDLSGKLRVKSSQGFSYVGLIVDQYSDYFSVALVCRKNELPDCVLC